MPAKNNTCCFYNERRKVIYFCQKAKRPVSILLCTLTGHEAFISSLIFMGNQLSHKIQGAICRKTPASDLPAGVLEVTGRFELPNEGFADPCLTTWPRHHIWSEYFHSIWSGRRGSNSLPPPWQGGALPDELRPHIRGTGVILVPLKGGASDRNRTNDTGIFSPLLYRLSYRGAPDDDYYT